MQKPAALALRAAVEPCHSDCSDEEAQVPPGRTEGAASRAPLPHYGRYRGLLLRSQLVELLKYKVYDGRTVLYNDDYPRYPSHKVRAGAERSGGGAERTVTGAVGAALR